MMFLKRILETQQDLQNCSSARDIRISVGDNVVKLYDTVSGNLKMLYGAQT
jgi:hypothetical protein